MSLNAEKQFQHIFDIITHNLSARCKSTLNKTLNIH